MIREGLAFEVIPGPTAVSTALLYSGFNPQHHVFLGFMPRKPNDIIRLAESMKVMSGEMKDMVFVAYESPNRINDTLKILTGAIPEADVVVTREMTKKFEEIVRGKPAELAKREFRGEITLVMKLA
jgi:16S rRNA (cytidine1402-2'-O)-methyltransferase